MHIPFPPIDYIAEGMDQIQIPPMLTVRQKYDASRIADLRGHLLARLQAVSLGDVSNKRICITAGSRGIPHMPELYRTLVDHLKELGADPFIVPAMGSHGNADAKEQLGILARFGLTDESMGCPIYSSMDVVSYARLSNNVPLYVDKFAAKADGIILMHKVKPHTDYRAEHESGLLKMIAIGLAKHKGATAFHNLGFEHFSERIPECAKIFLDTFPVLLGIGIVQNAYDEICTVEVAPKDGIFSLDAALLAEAKRRIPQFKFKSTDLLIIDRIGKEISGFGADPNVTGRTNGIQSDFAGILQANKLFIAGLTEETHENGSGIAQADLTTRRCLNGIDWGTTWTNLITSGRIRGAAIPLYVENDRDAIRLGIRTCTGADHTHIRIARIRTTLELNDIQVSPALYAQIKHRDDIDLVEGAKPLSFDEDGFLLPFGGK